MIKLARIILNLSPLRYFSERSKKLNLPGFQGVPLYDVINFFNRQVKTQGLTERASAISFNFIMSIPPTCLFLFTLIPNLPFVSKSNLKNQIHILVDSITPIHDHMLLDFIYSFIDSATAGYVSFGLLLALFFASNGVMGLMRSFDRGYLGFSKRNALQKRWTAIKLTSLLFTLFFVCILLMISQSSVLTWLGIKNKFIKELIVYGRWLPIFLLIYYSFAFIYKYAPKVQKRWRLFSPGALFATLCSIIFYWGFSSFVNNFDRYNILYGSLGTVIVIMILVFLNSLAILIGFELNVSINSLKAIAEKRKLDEKAESST